MVVSPAALIVADADNPREDHCRAERPGPATARLPALLCGLTLALCGVLTAPPPAHGQAAFAQAQPGLGGRGHWRTYGVTDGLAALDVWVVFRDRDGILWFGTEGGGVSRFDGNRWTSFSANDGLVDNSVYDIVQDAAGTITATSDVGVGTTFTLRIGDFPPDAAPRRSGSTSGD